MPEIIGTELMSRDYDDLLGSHFGIKKTRELMIWKNYWPILQHDIETYVKSYNVYLASKAVHYKLHGNLQSLAISTYCWKDLFMDFITRLIIFIK